MKQNPDNLGRVVGQRDSKGLGGWVKVNEVLLIYQ